MDKFINAILFFAEKTDKEKFGITKLMKLLFYADFLHYEKFGRSIFGDEYYRLPEGPVPSISYDIFKKLERGEVPELNGIVKIREKLIGNFVMKQIEGLKRFDENVFSESDVEVMSEIAERFYNTGGKEMSQKTHEIPFVQDASRVLPIDYNVVVEDPNDLAYLKELKKESESIAYSLNAE